MRQYLRSTIFWLYLQNQNMESIRFIVSTIRKLQIEDSFRINQKLKMLKREDGICFDDLFGYVVRIFSLNIPMFFVCGRESAKTEYHEMHRTKHIQPKCSCEEK